MNYRIVVDSSANVLTLPGQNYASVPMKVNADREYVDNDQLNLAEMVEALQQHKAQIWNLDRTETELHREPPDPTLEAVARLVTSEQPEWTGSPSELAEALNTGMAANALTKYLNIKCGRLKDEYGISYENKAKHSGRRVTLTYTTK